MCDRLKNTIRKKKKQIKHTNWKLCHAEHKELESGKLLTADGRRRKYKKELLSLKKKKNFLIFNFDFLIFWTIIIKHIDFFYYSFAALVYALL